MLFIYKMLYSIISDHQLSYKQCVFFLFPFPHNSMYLSSSFFQNPVQHLQAHLRDSTGLLPDHIIKQILQ